MVHKLALRIGLATAQKAACERSRPPGPLPTAWWLDRIKSVDGSVEHKRLPLESEAVRWMFLTRDMGLTCEMIAQYMPQRYQDLKTDSWDRHSIAKTLRNPAAKGELRQGKKADGKLIEQCPPVVRADLFDGVQKTSRARQRSGQRNINFNRFADKARCEFCGELMVSRQTKHGRSLVCKSPMHECPAARRPWAIEHFNRAVAEIVSEIGRRRFCIDLLQTELNAAKFGLELWSEKKSKITQQIDAVGSVPTGGQALHDEDQQIDQLQRLISRLEAKLRQLKDEGTKPSELYVDHLSLDRVNESRIGKLVHDVVVAPLGTEAGIDERRRLAKEVEATANFGLDLVHGIEELQGDRIFRIRLKGGQEVICWADKINPAKVSYQFSDRQGDRPERAASSKNHLLFAVPLPSDDRPLEFRIALRARPEQDQPSVGAEQKGVSKASH